MAAVRSREKETAPDGLNAGAVRTENQGDSQEAEYLAKETTYYSVMRYGGQTLIIFDRQPSGVIRKKLYQYGYQHHLDRGNQFIGNGGEGDLLKTLRHWKKGFARTIQSETICWDCSNCYGGCSWAEDGVPVEGWVAERCDRELNEKKRKNRNWTGYSVSYCPEFEPDAPDRNLKLVSDTNRHGWQTLANAIILSAAAEHRENYKQWLKDPTSKKLRRRLDKTEYFFLSQYFSSLTKLDGKTLLRQIEEMVENGIETDMHLKRIYMKTRNPKKWRKDSWSL